MLASTPVLSLIAGFALVMLGLSYRWGQNRGFSPQVVLAGAGAAGTLIFGIRGFLLGEFTPLPMPVLIWGTIAGLGQLAAIYLLDAAMKRGAFGLVWCALNLCFIPVAFYSLVFTSEAQSVWQWSAIALAIASIIIASTGKPPAGSATAGVPKSPATAILFAVLLFLLMFCAGLTNVGIKALGVARPPFAASMPRYAEAYLTLLYVILFVGIVLKGVSNRHRAPNFRRAAAPVLTGAAGSVIVLGCFVQAGAAPNVIIFVVSSILSVMGGFIGAAIFFKDPLTPRSWIVITLGLLSVICMAM
jgi:hypothetical protein